MFRIEGNKLEKLFNLFSFSSRFILARFAFHHQHIISYQRATITSWCWQICKATWRCHSHPSLSRNTLIKLSQAVGIHRTFHSCQRRLIRRRSCGLCLRFKCCNFYVSLYLFLRANTREILLNKPILWKSGSSIFFIENRITFLLYYKRDVVTLTLTSRWSAIKFIIYHFLIEPGQKWWHKKSFFVIFFNRHSTKI